MILPEKDYLDYLSKGRFMLLRNRSTKKCFFYPRVAEPVTGSLDLEWVEACGRGRVYSTTIVRRKPPALAYNVALIDLEEGPRMMSTVVGVPPEQVSIGAAVVAKVVQDEKLPYVVFELAGD